MTRSKTVGVLGEAETILAKPYPEHAKLAPRSKLDVIHDFFDWMRDQGITDMDWTEVEDLIRTWKGVDKAAYEAESADLKTKYSWLWKQFGLWDDPVEPRLRINRPVAAAPVVPEDASALDILMASIRKDR